MLYSPARDPVRPRTRSPGDVRASIARLFDVSAAKIDALEARWRPERRRARSSPSRASIVRAGGRSGRRDFSSARRCCSSTPPANRAFLELGRSRTCERMASHLTHVGVHDHGFNNVSTYGVLRRLARERRFDAGRLGGPLLRSGTPGEWRRSRRGAGRRFRHGGFIYSFNGAHSLFVDTIRSLRALAIGASARPPPGRGTGRRRRSPRSAREARPRHR